MIGAEGGNERLKAYIRLMLAESDRISRAMIGQCGGLPGSAPVVGGGKAEHSSSGTRKKKGRRVGS
jgi:hypothetical protein